METRSKGGRGVVLGLLVLLFLGAAAQAELITIAIEATVDLVADSKNMLGGAISVGDTITGYYSYDTSAIDHFPSDDTFGAYLWETEPYGMYLEINGISFMTDPEDVRFYYRMYNDYSQSVSDRFLVDSLNNTTSLQGVSISRIVWELWDPSGSAFDNDALLSGAPDLGVDWDLNLIGIGLDSRNGIGGHVTSAYIIPEPMTLFFLGMGGLFLKKKQVIKF